MYDGIPRFIKLHLNFKVYKYNTYSCFITGSYGCIILNNISGKMMLEYHIIMFLRYSEIQVFIREIICY